MTKDQIVKRLEEIIETINKAQDDVTSGLIQDLSFMDKDVAQVCGDIIKLEPKDAAAVQPIMADMISRLEGLAQSLQSFKETFNQSE
ncbi:MAG: hypothetical protein CMH31_04385 [Micavibrio sp.]|nr:hypothetical protein [Micavibrio sp.]|tara:strand:- start:472 stop:732 length:261 start_codon:yes stop_codon:yes gene_type:complete